MLVRIKCACAVHPNVDLVQLDGVQCRIEGFLYQSYGKGAFIRAQAGCSVAEARALPSI